MSELYRVLIVDDERDLREGLQFALEKRGYTCEIAADLTSAYQALKNHVFSAVLTDYRIGPEKGFDLIKEIRAKYPATKTIVMTAYGGVSHAVEAMQIGADHYLCKPFSVDELDAQLQRLIGPKQIQASELMTKDERMLAILKKARRAAQSSAPVLIEGPSGTGKELLARQIHRWSPRGDRPWIAINCAALPSGLLESELFGFEKGAFTGALDRKIGKFELAHQGTLLLDEIAELDPLLQAKLLRVLQEGEVDRLGGKRPVKVDVRIIATTNKSLERMVAEGKFREDLYFRLYGVKITLPALRDRPQDVDLLASTFLERQAKIQGRDLKFAPGVIEALQALDWNGNVRELERAVERACVLSDSGMVEIDHFEFVKPVTIRVSTDPNVKSIRDMEREIILKALEAHNGNRTHTAKSLGMSLRTLRHKIKTYREMGVNVDPAGARQERVGKWFPFEGDDALLGARSLTFEGGEKLAKDV